MIDYEVRQQIELFQFHFNGNKNNKNHEIHSSKCLISVDMQLVRFRGLVQNMLDPEIYLESYQTKTDAETLALRKGKFRDNLKLQVSVTSVKSIELFLFYSI